MRVELEIVKIYWAWYASEFYGEDVFYGFEVEFGYFSLKELQSVRGPRGLPIERDLYFQPKALGELLDRYILQKRFPSVETSHFLFLVIIQLILWQASIRY